MDHVPGDFWSTHLLKVSLERCSVIECCELNGKCICFIFTTDTESNASLNNKSAVEEVTMCIIHTFMTSSHNVSFFLCNFIGDHKYGK